jgi:hypothetical protein
VEERHRDRIAAGLTKRRGGDLDDPEDQRDLWNLAKSVSRVSINCPHADFPIGEGTTAEEENAAFLRLLRPRGNLTQVRSASADVDWSPVSAETRQTGMPRDWCGA